MLCPATLLAFHYMVPVRNSTREQNAIQRVDDGTPTPCQPRHIHRKAGWAWCILFTKNRAFVLLNNIESLPPSSSLRPPFQKATSFVFTSPDGNFIPVRGGLMEISWLHTGYVQNVWIALHDAETVRDWDPRRPPLYNGKAVNQLQMRYLSASTRII